MAYVAAGAAASVAAVWIAVVAPYHARQVRFEHELSAARAIAARQAAETGRLAEELRRIRDRRGPVLVASADDAAAVEAAVLTGRLPLPRSLSALTSTLRGDSEPGEDDLRLVSPVATFVLSHRPVLRVRAARGVTGVEATVTDPSGAEVPVDRLSPNSWRVRRPLQPGDVYQWSVQGFLRGRPVVSAVASFAVVAPEAGAEVRAASARRGGQPLYLAVLYARAGLLDDADKALARVLQDHPRHPIAAALKVDLDRTRAGPP